MQRSSFNKKEETADTRFVIQYMVKGVGLGLSACCFDPKISVRGPSLTFFLDNFGLTESSVSST